MGFSRLYGRDLQHWSPPYQTNSNLVSHAVFGTHCVPKEVYLDESDCDDGDQGLWLLMNNLNIL